LKELAVEVIASKESKTLPDENREKASIRSKIPTFKKLTSEVEEPRVGTSCPRGYTLIAM
jgi:hypothetical protein